MVVSPHALMESQGRLRLHANYYITKQIIPALERVVSLVGGDMRAWFATMPRPQRLLPQKRPAAALGLGGRSSAGTIDAYYLSRHCAVGAVLCIGASSKQPRCQDNGPSSWKSRRPGPLYALGDTLLLEGQT